MFTTKQGPKARQTAPSPVYGEIAGTPFFQAKLTVNQPGEAHEREADAVAEQVVRMKTGDAPVLQRMPLSPLPGGLQRKCAGCEKEEKLQRKDTGGDSSGGKTAPNSRTLSAIGAGVFSTASADRTSARLMHNATDRMAR